MTILLALIIPVSIAITGFLVLKSVQLGLRWQIEAKEKKPPTMNDPVKQFVEQKKEDKQAEETENIMSEWLNGK